LGNGEDNLTGSDPLILPEPARNHPSFRVLILGASYGSLLASKLLLAGHSVTVVCLPNEADQINREGIRTRFPLDGPDADVVLDSRNLPGKLSATSPSGATPLEFDLVVLAMQEPQYRFSEVQALLRSVADSRTPCLSIMNMPPLPYLARIPRIEAAACRTCYTNADVWDAFDPSLITHCSADPQATRGAGPDPAALQVHLASNFKAARFANDSDNEILNALASSIDDASRANTRAGHELPVKLNVYASVFVPLSKWPMLITGNYRCIGADGIRSIESAVHADLDASRAVYEWVLRVCRTLGASRRDLIPFGMYAKAARQLKSPSSAAKALAAGADHIERVDRLVQTVAAQQNMQLDALDEIVDRIDRKLSGSHVYAPQRDTRHMGFPRRATGRKTKQKTRTVPTVNESPANDNMRDKL
jgi:hypothetical protein